MKNIRKIFAGLMAMCMVMSLCATSFAADVETETEPAAAVATVDANEASTQADEATEVTPRQSIGKLLAGRSGNFYGSGYLEVDLDYGNAWADIQAGTGPSNCNGAVIISVKFPNGQWHELGTVMANADHTIYNEFVYCPAGTYLFYFQNTTSDWIQVYANIYD